MDRPRRFRDRSEAGRILAAKLLPYANRSDVVVLGMPRGGVPVAFEVAQILHAPLDVLLVRKLGVPGNNELAMGAVALENICILQSDVIQHLGISESMIEEVATRELKELARRNEIYRGSQPPRDLKGKTIILVDDGLATGSTMLAAINAMKRQNCGRIVVAVPVAAAELCEKFKSEVDEIICASTPASFYAVSHWYENFAQITDDEVRELLHRANKEISPCA